MIWNVRGEMKGSNGPIQIINADRTVPFRETVARFREALGKKCKFRVRARKFYRTVWISDCYTDFTQPALLRAYVGPLLEGMALRTMGKGLSKDQVTAGALAEAIERVSFFDGLSRGRETPIYELTSEAELLPSSLTIADMPHLNDTCDGVAAGNTVEECIFHGLLEMYEHRDVARYMGRFGLGHRQFVNPLISGFRPTVAEKMLAVSALGDNEKVTTIHAVVCPKDLGPYVRTCAHLDGRIALQRAFNETVQSHKTRQADDLQTFSARVDIDQLPNYFSEDLRENIKAALEGIGERVYVQDWTDPEMGVPVLRPFLQTMQKNHNVERIEAYVETMMEEACQYIVWE